MLATLGSLDALVIVHHSLLLRARKSNGINGTRSKLNIMIPGFVIVDVLLVASRDLKAK
jgi:hypothetical protein